MARNPARASRWKLQFGILRVMNRNQGTPCLTCFRSNNLENIHGAAPERLFVIESTVFGTIIEIA
jgi:hypothetical protein